MILFLKTDIQLMTNWIWTSKLGFFQCRICAIQLLKNNYPYQKKARNLPQSSLWAGEKEWEIEIVLQISVIEIWFYN